METSLVAQHSLTLKYIMWSDLKIHKLLWATKSSNSHKEASHLNYEKKKKRTPPKNPRYFEHTLGQDMVLWMLFSMLVPAATVIWKRGQQRFCWMEQNVVQCYSIFKLHHEYKKNVIIIQASWSKTTKMWLNWNSHKRIESIVTSPGSWGDQSNQRVWGFGILLCCVHRENSEALSNHQATMEK